MSGVVRIRLEPLGVAFEIERGRSIEDALFQYGVEFPCGGAGHCGSCKVRVLEGHARITSADRDLFEESDLAAGWRLACHLRPETPLTLLVDQWETPILADFEPAPGSTRTGAGIAVDLGTTTIVVQSVDLATGAVLGVRTALNPQSVHGADIMSRIEFAMRDRCLTPLIQRTIASLIDGLLAGERPSGIVLVGNTAMHHIFCGLNVSPLAAVPFRSPWLGDQIVECAGYPMRFIRCLGGFVGSDILAGILATGLHQSGELSALIDLGTNGEIVLGSRRRLVCASTAAGPAFEAGRIGAGMRAATGAISRVVLEHGALRCHIIGGGPPRGICGSGLVDAAAAGLDLGAIEPNGRLRGGVLPLCDGISLKQADIRELQLAKGAVAAGLHILLDRIGATWSDLRRVYLAGAFGNYVDVASASRIGLLPVDPAIVQPSGNTALRGARMILLGPSLPDAVQVEHVELAADPAFEERFAAALAFPPRSSSP